MDANILGPTGRVVSETVFKGCENRAQVAAFMSAQVVEARVSGAVVGFLVGAVAGAVGVGWFLFRNDRAAGAVGALAKRR